MFELVVWLELVLVGAAASVPLWLCVLAAIAVAVVCVTLVIGGEEEDVSRRVPSRPCAGKEENAKRAAVALRVLLLEIKHEDDRRDVEQAARIALKRSGVIEADE